MTVTLVGERMGQRASGTGVDKVLDGFDLPAGSVLKKLKVDVHMVGAMVSMERETAMAYACACYLIPIPDPDTAVTYDDLWDRFVVKYTDTDGIDLDTAANDVGPFWEPGEASFEQVFEMGDQPLRLWQRKKLLTFADPGNAGLRFQPAESPFEPQWIPSDKFTIKLNKSIRVPKPASVLWAVAIPAFDDTITTRTMLAENEWGRIQYVEQTLDQALIDQLDLVEAGAETPWEDASVLLRKHLAPNVLEETATRFDTQQFVMYHTAQFEHSVPGHRSYKRIDITP